MNSYNSEDESVESIPREVLPIKDTQGILRLLYNGTEARHYKLETGIVNSGLIRKLIEDKALNGLRRAIVFQRYSASSRVGNNNVNWYPAGIYLRTAHFEKQIKDLARKAKLEQKDN